MWDHGKSIKSMSKQIKNLNYNEKIFNFLKKFNP